MCSPGYHHNVFVATHALGHRTYVPKCMSFHKAIVVMGKMDALHIYIYIYTTTQPLL